MIDRETFQQKTDALNELLRRRLGVRGRALKDRLRRAGRRLPKSARRAGQEIVRAQGQIDHPKLARMLDADGIDAAFATLTAHLNAHDAADRRKGAILGTLGAMVFNLILLVVVLIVVLQWQGLV